MDNNSEIETLRTEIKNLGARVQALDDQLQRIIRLAKEFDMANANHCTLLQRGQDEAFERIKNLELSVFPNLARDIQNLHGIIGEGENKADNPLDRRGK